MPARRPSPAPACAAPAAAVLSGARLPHSNAGRTVCFLLRCNAAYCGAMGSGLAVGARAARRARRWRGCRSGMATCCCPARPACARPRPRGACSGPGPAAWAASRSGRPSWARCARTRPGRPQRERLPGDVRLVWRRRGRCGGRGRDVHRPAARQRLCALPGRPLRRAVPHLGGAGARAAGRTLQGSLHHVQPRWLIVRWSW